MTVCSICPRTAPDGHHACPLHAGELHAWLAELPQQTRLLGDFLTPSTSPPAGRLGGAGRAHAPVPVDIRVLNLLGPGHHVSPEDPYGDGDGTAVPIGALVRGWADYIATEHQAVTRDQYGTAHHRQCNGASPRHGTTVTGWCAWLTAYLPYAITQPWVGELHHQLGDLLAVIRDLTHAVPRTHRQIASCPKCEAFALVRTDGLWGITCEACGHHLEPAEYDQHAAALASRLAANRTLDPTG